MEFLKSTFGVYAEAANMQVLIDSSKARFNTPFWTRFFRMGTPGLQLSYTTILGKSRIDAAATLVSRNGRTPLKGRPNIGKLNGNIPVMKTMKKLEEDDYRDFLTLQQLQVADAAKKAQIFSLLFDDVLSVSNSIDKKIDYLCLEGMSTGYITITADNNPGGIVQDTLDLLLPVEQRMGVPQTLRLENGTINPDFDIVEILKNAKIRAKNLNKPLGRAVMDEYTYDDVLLTPKLATYMKGFYNPGANARYVVTSDSFQEFLRASKLPAIETIDEVVHITVDDVDYPVRPFKAENIVFIPEEGMIGEIKCALAMEDLKPVPQVSYTKTGNKLISKWFANEPFGEFTKAEFNGMPSFDAMDAMFIIQLDVEEAFDPSEYKFGEPAA